MHHNVLRPRLAPQHMCVCVYVCVCRGVCVCVWLLLPLFRGCPELLFLNGVLECIFSGVLSGSFGSMSQGFFWFFIVPFLQFTLLPLLTTLVSSTFCLGEISCFSFPCFNLMPERLVDFGR